MMVSLVPLRVSRSRARGWRLSVAVLYFLLTLLVFVLTSLPGVNRLTPVLALALLSFLLLTRFLPKLPRGSVTLLWVMFVLLLVGSSGWFFSPFFFALYLAAIALGFMYGPVSTVGFTLGILALFLVSVGEVSPSADFMTLLSLLSVVPITIALRRSFLIVQQEKKDILILESDEKDTSLLALDSILKNQINKIAITIRQPITYIRQGLSLLKDNTLTDEEYPDVLNRMSCAADEVFTVVKEFESDTTKNTLLGRTPSTDTKE